MKQRSFSSWMVIASIILVLPMTVFISSAYSYDANVSQTGQTASYFAGDDGDLQMGVAWPTTGNMGSGRFDDNGDGTVTDLLTGLMWTKNANNGPDTFYNARNAATALATGGHTDWRMPNILELESLTHAGEADTSAWLNSIGFQNVQAVEYWSSTQYVNLGNGGWTINLGTDQTNYWMAWTATRHYWAVRGGANGDPDPSYLANVRDTGRTTSTTPGDDGDLEWGVDWSVATRYIDNGDGTMSDTLTGLMWAQNVDTDGTLSEILSLAGAIAYIDDMNTGNNGRCVADASNYPRCYPYLDSCGPGNNLPCPLPATYCPGDLTCVGAREANPWNSNPPVGAEYGECKRTGVETEHLKPFAQTCRQDNVARLLSGNPPEGIPDEIAAKVAKFIGYKAPIALKVANEIIDQQVGKSMEDAIEVELSRCKDIFSTGDALLGLSNIGKRVKYKGA